MSSQYQWLHIKGLNYRIISITHIFINLLSILIFNDIKSVIIQITGVLTLHSEYIRLIVTIWSHWGTLILCVLIWGIWTVVTLTPSGTLSDTGTTSYTTGSRSYTLPDTTTGTRSITWPRSSTTGVATEGLTPINEDTPDPTNVVTSLSISTIKHSRL